jgi:drug/metabolite transporter (DMT)-like permease
VSRHSIGACIICICGIVLVVGFDYGELKGNLLAVASAVLYSAYSLVLRAKSPDNVDISMSMMFGFIGWWFRLPQIENYTSAMNNFYLDRAFFFHRVWFLVAHFALFPC